MSAIAHAYLVQYIPMIGNHLQLIDKKEILDNSGYSYKINKYVFV